MGVKASRVIVILTPTLALPRQGGGNQIYTAQRPLNTGLRFSLNARTPS